jgi:phage-related protein
MADFTLTNYSKVEEIIEFKTLVTRFENGSEQRRNKWGNPLKTFRLSYQNRPESEVDSLKTFFEEKKGAYTAFTFDNPNDETEYNVRFASDSLEVKRVAYDVYDFSFDLKEVR